jgi:hypothetical protein
VEALSNRGVSLHELRRFEEALASCDRALALHPDHAEAHSNRGNALNGLTRFEEAAASYDRALALSPNYAEALTNRGVTLHMLKRDEEALSCYQRAVAMRPDFAEAHYNEGCCRLVTGDLHRGWQKYEWRWLLAEQRAEARRNFSEPLWTGAEDIAGKTLLLHAEQGFGDTIQFCRYVPLVVERGANVILEVQPALAVLMRTLPCAMQIIAHGEALPAFDMHCPLLSLPRAFDTELTTIPSTIPYLRAAPPAATEWLTRLNAMRRPRIGLAWSGSPTHKNDHNRSIALASLLPALAGIDATFISLQREIRAADAATLVEQNDLVRLGEELKDFSDTAALISNLDLVVAVDTGVAHLAGALAKAVWVMLPYNPDWRWLLDRDDSPWYPTATLFRQDETRAWESVLRPIRSALRQYVHAAIGSN